MDHFSSSVWLVDAFGVQGQVADEVSCGVKIRMSRSATRIRTALPLAHGRTAYLVGQTLVVRSRVGEVPCSFWLHVIVGELGEGFEGSQS